MGLKFLPKCDSWIVCVCVCVYGIGQYSRVLGRILDYVSEGHCVNCWVYYCDRSG